jgi:histone acetyltransferase (RNA polymerase elongator complex component)
MGFGKRLMARAEEIVRTQYPTIEHIAVIAGA